MPLLLLLWLLLRGDLERAEVELGRATPSPATDAKASTAAAATPTTKPSAPVADDEVWYQKSGQTEGLRSRGMEWATDVCINDIQSEDDDLEEGRKHYPRTRGSTSGFDYYPMPVTFMIHLLQRYTNKECKQRSLFNQVRRPWLVAVPSVRPSEVRLQHAAGQRRRHDRQPLRARLRA